MPAKKKKPINLLPQDDSETTTFGRILRWALSTFRIMVIVTETVVMGAFLSRFWLDAKNSDLGEEINATMAQVLAYSDIEEQFRREQQRVNVLKAMYDYQKQSEYFDEVSRLMPSDLTLSAISLNEESLLVKADSYSEQSVAQFLANLNNSSSLKNPSLTQISTSSDNEALYVFSITAETKEEK